MENQFIGYVATYRHKEWGNGFLANDSQSDYPFFNEVPDARHTHKDVKKAFKDAAMIKKSMRTYYGNGRVDFDSVKVVKLMYAFEEVKEEDAALESALSKLTNEEYLAIVRHMDSEV